MPDQFYHQFSDPTLLLDVLTQFVRGELGEAERKIVERYLAEHGRDAALASALATLRAGEGADSSTREIEARVAALATQIRSAPEAETGRSVRPSGARGNTLHFSRRVFPQRIGVLSALCVAAIVAAVFTVRGTRPDVSNTRSYSTPLGKIARVTFADGSRATIAPGSILRVTEFTSRARTLALAGEAYFEVTAGAASPFVVWTGEVSTKVLGTAFSVRHYAADTAVRVSVASGKVVAHGRGVPVTVVTGTSAWVTDSTAQVVRTDDVHIQTDWEQGHLIFHDARVPELLASLGRWYGYEFTLSDTVLAARKVSVTFKMKDRADMFVALKDVLDVSMTFDGTHVTLVPRRERMRIRTKQQSVFTSSREIGK